MKGSSGGGGGYVCLMIPRERTGKELVIERAILEQVFQFRSCSCSDPIAGQQSISRRSGARVGREEERETLT